MGVGIGIGFQPPRPVFALTKWSEITFATWQEITTTWN